MDPHLPANWRLPDPRFPSRIKKIKARLAKAKRKKMRKKER